LSCFALAYNASIQNSFGAYRTTVHDPETASFTHSSPPPTRLSHAALTRNYLTGLGILHYELM
jgi:hypothetical protein